MANKFGKFLLFTAAVGTGVATAYYILKNKDAQNAAFFDEDEDYDDFSESYEEDLDARSYVTLRDAQEESDSADNFVSLAETVASRTEDVVEEFFDEDDTEEMES